LFPAKQQPILFDILIVMSQTFLIEFGVVLVVAASLGIVARLLKQPLILAYLVAGVIIGPFAFGLVRDYSIIETFASIGIIFLLFLVGLELNPRRLLEVGKSALIIGVSQIILSGLIYYLVAVKFGLTGIGAFYLAGAFTFSSTAIIVTLLSNRNDLDTLHGKLLIGILLVQDFVAISLLAVASGVKSSSGILWQQIAYQIPIRAITLFILTFLIAKYILPLIFNRIARSQELLFLSSLAWCFFLSIIAYALGFSAEIGAFLAGISLAPLPFSSHIAIKTKPLRDFFIMIFFVYLGSTLVFSDLIEILTPAVIFVLLILIINPLIVIIVMSALGFRKRTSFLTGITLTQVSEFSFIIAALGVKLDILPGEISTLVSVVAISTVFISTYFISSAGKLYNFLRPILGLIESGKKSDYLLNIPEKLEDHVILIGYHRIGTIVLAELKEKKVKVAVIDVDSKRIHDLIENGEYCIYGDAADHDIVEHLNLKDAKMVISTLDRFEESISILEIYKKIKPSLKFIMIASNNEDALELYKAGADLVILPTLIAGDHINHILGQLEQKSTRLNELREKSLKELKEQS